MTRAEISKLVQRARQGRTDAFRTIVEAYKDRLFAFVWKILRDHHEAEDLCQAAFVKAYESLDSYSDKYAFSTWLFTIAYRLCLNQLRRKRHWTGEVDFAGFGSGSEDVAHEVANTEQARKLKDEIWSAVEQLSPQQRNAVVLFYREGLSCQEISQILSIPAVTVKSHLHRARERLRGLLSDQAEDWSILQARSG